MLRLLIISLYLVLSVYCGKSEKISAPEASKVEDVPWEGTEADIPPQMRELNPLASKDAKKGGVIRNYSNQYPKSLNYYLEQFSTTAEIFRMMFEPLISYHPATLQPIPRLAKSWKISADKKKFRFELDKNAKWSDGKPVTAQDVVFTFQTIMDKKNNTAVFRIELSRFEEPIIIDDYTVEFAAKDNHWNNFDAVGGHLFILPKHYFEGKDFNKINEEFPVISGPYRLAEAKQGRYVRMTRRGDYWQRAYPFNKGRYNFNDIFFKVFSEEAVAFQAMLKGDMDLYPAYKAATWVKEAVGEKFDKFWIAKQRIFNKKPIGFQGWAMNLRRDLFKDKKVRQAIAHLVDRKTMVDKFAYNEYDVTNSYYPDYYLGNEKAKNPNPPVEYDLEKARALFKEAGWKPNAAGILEKNGKEFKVKILDREKSTERYFTFFMESAKKVGIIAELESTDLAGWSARMDKFDFDLTWTAWGGGVFKDPEPMWHSKYAKEEGQHNYPGVEIPAVDALIEKQKTIFDIEERNRIVKEIDRIIYTEYPYVLLWHLDNTRLMFWNRFGMPENPLGLYGGESFALEYWWFDENRNKALMQAYENKTALPALPANVKLN